MKGGFNHAREKKPVRFGERMLRDRLKEYGFSCFRPVSKSVIYDEQQEETFMHSLVGYPAIPFEMIDASGKSHRLDDYRGGWLLMVFHRHLG